jgi:Rps23 Pro-64 3,4-dihydroxylase Tpa1-like proline 4-hydroxylase
MAGLILASGCVGVRPLMESQLQAFRHNRYVVVPNWMSIAQTASIQKDALAVNSYKSVECMVGTARTGAARVDPNVRISRESPFYPPPPNAAGSVATRAGVIEAVNTLRSELQASAVMNLPYLQPFQTEIKYLCYPNGGHYKRHLDQPLDNDGWVRQGRRAADGGSFCGGRTRRVVTFLIYLNRNWDVQQGGALRIFPAHEHMHTMPHSQSPIAAHAEDVPPEGGTLVLLMSGDVEHLVRETYAERQCIVGWFSEFSSGRVPDLDSMSLRTPFG